MHYMSIPPPNWTKGEIQVGIICSIFILLLAIFWYVSIQPKIYSISYSLQRFPLLLAHHHAETVAGMDHSQREVTAKCLSNTVMLVTSQLIVTNIESDVQHQRYLGVCLKWQKSYFPPSNQNELKENGEIVPDEELKILIQNEVALRESMVHRL